MRSMIRNDEYYDAELKVYRLHYACIKERGSLSSPRARIIIIKNRFCKNESKLFTKCEIMT